MSLKSFVRCLFPLLALLLSQCKQVSLQSDAYEVGAIKKVVPGIILAKRLINSHQKINDNQRHNDLTDTDYNQIRAVEYVVKLESGSVISVIQSEGLNLNNKQKILVLYGKKNRVIADDGSKFQ